MTLPLLEQASNARWSLALSFADGVGPRRQRDLVERHGSAEGAACATMSGAQREQALARADDLLARAQQAGIVATSPGDDLYPADLLDLGDPPPVIFARGIHETLARTRVAIVGTRRPTPYGERVARNLANALARGGACVVSGMALGIDGEAHRGALEAEGATVAILGTGVDVAYPASHRALHRTILDKGLVLSEFEPGSPARPGSFPRRNRIIAALAQLVIVVEAPERSGALNTAEHALDLGRTVAAIPGPIDSGQSAGTNQLLRDGAAFIGSIGDALALASLTPVVHTQSLEMNANERAVWDALSHGPLDVDSLTARTRLPARHCLAAVTALELAGAVDCELTGVIRRR